jgi:hypothetical protein
MEFNWSIVGWIAGLVFVYLFGLFEGRGQGYKRRKAEEEQGNKTQPPSPSPKPEMVTGDDPGLMRIKNENGSFVLDLDGQRVNPISLSSEQRKRLIDVLNIMRPWLEGRAAPASQPAARRAEVTPVTVEERLNAFGGPPSESKPIHQKPPSPPPQPVQPPVARAGTIAKEDRPAAPANSIVGQIDAILQSRLSGTHLEGRGIFLAQSQEGGVAVFVGLTRYNAIDDVPDPEIKSAIRAAISEWENKYTPGI